MIQSVHRDTRLSGLFMWTGRRRTIRFQFTGPFVQAAMNKIIEEASQKRRKSGTTVARYVKMGSAPASVAIMIQNIKVK